MQLSSLSAVPGCELVVARYDESLRWTRIFNRCRLTVYNKGRHPIEGGVPSIPLPNVGRESHTYLHHIVQRYDTLASTTIFFQGAINSRVEQRLARADSYMNNSENSFFGNHVRVAQHPFNWRYPSRTRYPRNGNATRSMSAYTLGEFFTKVLHRKYVSNADYQRSLKGTRNRTRGEPGPVRWVPGAYFSVGRNLVHRNPRQYYKHILNATNLTLCADPEDGHYMERAWMAILQPQRKPQPKQMIELRKP